MRSNGLMSASSSAVASPAANILPSVYRDAASNRAARSCRRVSQAVRVAASSTSGRPFRTATIGALVEASVQLRRPVKAIDHVQHSLPPV